MHQNHFYIGDDTAIRELPTLAHVDHQQVISTSRCNDVIKKLHRPTRRRERQQQGFKRKKRTQEFLHHHSRIDNLHLHARIENLYHHSRTSVSATTTRNNQKWAFQTCSVVAAGVA